MKINIKAYTIIELVIIIAIIAILSTIAYIAVQDYNKETRNVVRTADINIIEKALELYYLNSNKYPNPDNYIELYNDGVLLWKQGIIGSGVILQLKALNSIPTDPFLYKNYTYSVSYNNQKYQIGYLKEK